MRSFFIDLNCAFRTLRQTPFFAFVVAGILALGIGFNAIVFSVVNSVLLKPLPYPEPSQLVVLQGESGHHRLVQDLAAPTFFFVREHATLLEDVTATYPIDVGVNLAGVGTPTYVRALRVSSNFCHVLRATPYAGRTFDENEDKPGGPRVAVLSYALWKRRSKEGSSGIGDVLRINGEPYTAIGVMPQGFRSYPEADLWLPLQLSPATADPGPDYRVIARLGKGVSMLRAQEELRQLSAAYPLAAVPAAERQMLDIQELQVFETRDLRDRLKFLMSAVLLVLLITCANVAMLLLVRASARIQDVAIRSALGSSRGRLLQFFFLESALLVVCGGLLGIILAKELLPGVLSLAPQRLPLTAEVHIDWNVAIFTLGICALAAVFFCVIPMVKFSRFALAEMLGEAAFHASASPRQVRTGRVLLVSQIAFTLVLLSGSIILLRHLLNLERIPPGFDTSKTSVAQVSLAAQQYRTTAPSAQVLERVMQKIRALGFVEGVASINGLPLEKGLNMPARPGEAPGNVESAEYRLISQDYFAVMQIPVVQGRSFSTTDSARAQPVAIVNETFARKLWPGERALGRYVVVGEAIGRDFTDSPRLIVGVTADVHQSSLEQPSRPTIFVPLQQASDKFTEYANKHFLTSIIVRSTITGDITEKIRDAMESADPDLSLASFRPLSQVVASSFTRERFYTLLTVAFGSFALLITAVGLYGLMSYQVSLRTREIAVRMAVGARRSKVVMMVVGEGLQLMAVGILVGAAMSFLFKRVFAGTLYGLENLAWGALVHAILLMITVAVLASLLTAFRLASIDVMVVLRNE